MKEQKKKPKLQIFDITRDGKGISKKAPINESGLKRFFITLKDNLGKLVSVNMFFVLGNFPIFFLVAVLSGYTKLSASIPTYDIFQNISSLFATTPPDPATMSIFALTGLHNTVLFNSTLTYVFYALGALVLLTFGAVNVGTAYILRNIAMGDPAFVWSDFWYAVKRNIKQALPFGIIDGLINALLIFNIFTTVTAGNFLLSMLFWANVVILVLYTSMRPYIYIQMVTFKLTVFKTFKNALIFSLLGLKRNILALIGVVLLLLIELSILFGFGGILISIAVALPLALMFSVMAYMKVYAAYFKIKEIMIDPCKAEHPEEFADEYDEAVMQDDVTRSEKLAEAKQRNGM